MASNPERIYWDSCTYLDYLEGTHALAPDMELMIEDWRRGLVTLVTSALTIAEVLFVKCAEEPRQPDRGRDREVDALFDPPPEQRFVLVELSRVTAIRARDLVRANGIKPKDAVHVASALEAHCEVLYTTEGPTKPLRANSRLVGGSPILRIEEPAWVRQLDYANLIESSAPSQPSAQSDDALQG